MSQFIRSRFQRKQLNNQYKQQNPKTVRASERAKVLRYRTRIEIRGSDIQNKTNWLESVEHFLKVGLRFLDIIDGVLSDVDELADLRLKIRFYWIIEFSTLQRNSDSVHFRVNNQHMIWKATFILSVRINSKRSSSVADSSSRIRSLQTYSNFTKLKKYG